VVVRFDGINGCSGNDPAFAGIDHQYVGDLAVSLKAPDGSNAGRLSCLVSFRMTSATSGSYPDIHGSFMPVTA